MSDWEKTKCILCGKNAERHPYSDRTPRNIEDYFGWKYKCEECPLYAIGGEWHPYIEYFALDEEKKALAEYLKNNPDTEGNFKKINTDFIKEALKTMPGSKLLKEAFSKKHKAENDS